VSDLLSGALVFLDDLEIRVEAARTGLDLVGASEVRLLTAHDAPSFTRLLQALPEDVLGFSLDWDLGTPRIDERGRHDPGTGTDAAMAIRDLGLRLPVMAHTSYPPGAQGMLALLPDCPTDYVTLRCTMEGSLRWARALLELLQPQDDALDMP
jgi:hypothetical protein